MSTDLDAEEKLIWLGVQTNSAKVNALADDIRQLEDTIGDYDGFESEVVDNWSSFQDLEDGLVNDYGWSQEDAAAFRDRVEREFANWGDFQDSLDDDASGPEDINSYEDLQQLFDQATTFQSDSLTQSGQTAAGIRVHESDGTSYAGVSVPAGTTEIFGVRVEFSQQDPPRGTEDPVTWGNISADETSPLVGQTVTLTADVSNPNGFSVVANADLREDGSVINSKGVNLSANETKTVSWDVVKRDYECHDYAIGKSDEVLVCWEPLNL